jgi:hypothetical protein
MNWITTKKEWLDNTVIIIDPVNPDGRDRYELVHQVDKPYGLLQIAAEHKRTMPGGRPNFITF